MSSFNQKLKIFQETYNTDKHSSINYLNDAKLSESDMLSATIVKLYGAFDKRFPLYLSTKGKNRVIKIKSADTTFKVPVIGKPKKASLIAKTPANTANLGVGKSVVVLYFADAFFRKAEMISSNAGTLCQVQKDLVREGDYWKAEVVIMGSNPAKSFTLKEISAGAKFSSMATPVGLKNSRGTESRSQSHGMMLNQCSYLRASYNYEGNISNKVVNIQLPTANGGSTMYWEQFETYQHELKFMEECENMYWYSEFNRDAKGIILDKDVNTGSVLPMGSGLLEQIPNSSTYGFLTKEKVKNTVRDVLYNSSADTVKEITLYTGVGGQEEFNNAFFADMKAEGFQYAMSEKVISGQPNTNGLTYGAYFGTFKHVDGHTIKLVHLPLMDNGAKAEAAPRHPKTGLPMTSYDMWFVDESTIDGKPNVVAVEEEGRGYIKKFISGINSKETNIANDGDASSIQFAKSIGIHMYNPVNSFKLSCNLS